MNDFLMLLTFFVLAGIFIYWRLRKTNAVFPDEAERCVKGAKNWNDGLQSQIVVYVNPRKGENLPPAGIGHNGGPPLDTWE